MSSAESNPVMEYLKCIREQTEGNPKQRAKEKYFGTDTAVTGKSADLHGKAELEWNHEAFVSI